MASILTYLPSLKVASSKLEELFGDVSSDPLLVRITSL